MLVDPVFRRMNRPEKAWASPFLCRARPVQESFTKNSFWGKFHTGGPEMHLESQDVLTSENGFLFSVRIKSGQGRPMSPFPRSFFAILYI